MKSTGSWPLAATLIVALGVLLLVGFVAAGAGVSSLVQSGLVNRALSAASATATAARSDLLREQRVRHTRPLSEDLADLASGGTYILVQNPHGAFQVSVGPIPPVMPAAGFLRAPPQGWYTAHRSVYAYARTSLPAAGGGFLWLVVVQSHGRLLGFMDVLNRILWIVGGILLLALLLALAAVVREVTGPLADLRRLADRVSETPTLADRVPPRASVQEVEALARAFNRMLDRLDQTQQRERRFASDAAHALRTPVQVIQGYATTLGRWGRLNPAVRAEALAAISQTAAGLERLIQRLLELARLEIHAPATAFQRVELGPWMERLRPTWEDVVAHHPLEVAPLSAVWTWTDPELLGAAVGILLENADVYATANSPVRVEVQSTADGPLLAVVNSGPPIPDSVRHHLFERFYRGQPDDASHFGLGLALADRMVEALQAQWIIASPQGHVQFGILLPAAPRTPLPSPPLRDQ